jgi:hypothetical protein
LGGLASWIMCRIPMEDARGAGERGVLRLRIPVRFANRNTALRMTTQNGSTRYETTDSALRFGFHGWTRHSLDRPASSSSGSEGLPLVGILVSYFSAQDAERWGSRLFGEGEIAWLAFWIMFRIPMGHAGGAGRRGVLRLRIPVRVANRNTALRMTT